MKQDLMPPVTTSLVDKTLADLMDLIIAKQLTKLPPQDHLSTKFGVSRSVLREALAQLEFLNVLTPRPKVGTTVNPPSAWKTRNEEVIGWIERATA